MPTVLRKWMRYRSSLLGLLLFSVACSPITTLAQDFANLSRYQKANLRLTSSNAEVDVVILGDSIAERWVRQRPEFFRSTGYLGRGIVGETTAQMLLRFQQDVIDLEPRVVVIVAGTNDIAGNSGPMSPNDTLYYLRVMLASAQAHGITPVLTSILPSQSFFWSEARDVSSRIEDLNEMIQKLASNADVTYVDFAIAMRTASGGMADNLSDDGVHPNNLGYAKMESRLRYYLKSLLAD
ncbi:MAG: GDSL-type esterase/lipase family protein [Pseudomonadota bacterium]